MERSRSAPKLGSITEDLVGEEEEERAMHFECEDILDTDDECVANGKQELTQIISDLGEMSIGNDVQTLKADLRVTRLLSGESTGSDSSIESSQEPAPLANGLGELRVQGIA